MWLYAPKRLELTKNATRAAATGDATKSVNSLISHTILWVHACRCRVRVPVSDFAVKGISMDVYPNARAAPVDTLRPCVKR